VNSEAIEDTGNMSVGGTTTNEEPLGNLLIRHPFGHQEQHLPLTTAQTVGSAAVTPGASLFGLLRCRDDRFGKGQPFSRR
jgi:hypothetical protein